MLHRTLLLALGALALSHARAVETPGVPEGWFPWPYVEPQRGSPLDSSALNHKPAGTHGFVDVRGARFVTRDNGARIRFWGCNLSSNEAFPPDAATAERVARRLAQGGVNIARLHHLDNPWSVESAGSLWKPGTQDRINLDPVQLDKLFRLVAAFKAEGVYSNVNLKVSRTHTEADGFPPSIVQTPAFQKRIDYFSRRIVDLQKDYARQLLTTRNPYTGLSLAEDPAVAVIELNNENSLLGLRTRDIGAGLHLLPEPWRGELATLWNAWLKRKYADDAALAAAWSRNATPPGRSPLSPASRWQPDAQSGNAVNVASSAPNAAHLTIHPGGDGVRWRSAAFLDRLVLDENATYTVTFAARADQARTAEITVSRDEPLWRTDKWRTRGLRSMVSFTPEWQEFRLVFIAHSVVDVDSRLSILAGHVPGQIWIKDLRIESGSTTAGLRERQSPRERTVPIPIDAMPNQWNDWLAFLVDVERDYVMELHAYLRDELQVQAPIVCTQANYGGIAGLVREQRSDFIDVHCYWQHPDWGNPASVWDTANYTINNTPQIAEFGARWFGELGGLAQLRVTGKPYTVSEFDHPAPNEFACEMYPVVSTFAALQDWDGIYTFDMVGLGVDADGGALGTFFDQANHPAKWSFGPFAARVLREGLVPLPASERELFVRAPFWSEANHIDVLWLKQQPGEDLGFLVDRLSVNERLLDSNEATHVVRRGESQPGAVRLHVIERDSSATASDADMHAYVAVMPRAACIVGPVGGGRVDAQSLAVTCDAFGRGFAAITAMSLDEQALHESARILVTVAARAENQGAQWNAARTSVGEIWGRGAPPIAERVPATIRLRTDGPRRVDALRPDGTPAAEIATEWQDGLLTFSTRDGPATMHYEVRAP